MALTDEGNSNGFYMPVAPAYGSGNGGSGNGWGCDWAWILLLLLIGGNGWGMGGFGGFNGGFGIDFPWLLNGQNAINANTNSGFDHAATQAALGNIQTAMTSGFGDVQTALCGGFAGVNASINGAANGLSQQMNANQMANLERSFAAQTANTQGMTALQAQLAQCCCDNRAATADLKYTVATEACADRAAISDGIRDVIESNNRTSQAILDKLCQLELDGVKGQLAQAQRENASLQSQAILATERAERTAQTGDIVNSIYNRLSSCPVGTTPVYGNQPIFTCNGNVGCGCGVA